jgi:hypothetical protein
MPNRPNEFQPPAPENIPEWADYQPRSRQHYGVPAIHGQRHGVTTLPSGYPAGGHGYQVPLPSGVSVPQHGAPLPQYGAQAGPVPFSPYGQVPFAPVPGYGAKPANALAVTSLVLGILAATYGIAMAGFVFGPLSIAFGVFGLAKARKQGDSGKGISAWGIGLGALGIALSAVMLGFVASTSSGYTEPSEQHHHEYYDDDEYGYYDDSTADADSF